jgi:hypothetical protein
MMTDQAEHMGSMSYLTVRRVWRPVHHLQGALKELAVCRLQVGPPAGKDCIPACSEGELQGQASRLIGTSHASADLCALQALL